jgi:serine/threonine protein kinase/tetratricopeptide (TPR) repeat protein
MIGQTFSHYRITKRLGKGGMGEVYAGEDIELGRRVALKFPTADENEASFYARFRREARAISALSHPHIATVYDYGETPSGQPFIVMELVQGCSLGDLLRDGKLSLSRKLEIIEQTAEALAEAHRHGVVHRDIKPSNLMINERGAVKVLDFGLAKHFGRPAHKAANREADMEAATLLASSTQQGVMVGTPLYFSPEQARGLPADPRSDLFALGIVLYESIAGRHPFAGANLIETISQILFVDPEPPSNANNPIPLELDQIALRLLSKQLETRYQNADELIADLRAVQNTLTEDGHVEGNSNGTGECKTITKGGRPNASTDSHGVEISARPVTNEDKQRRKRIFATVISGVVALCLLAGVWIFAPWSQAEIYRPPPEAFHWYETGVKALRDGAPLNASRAFERALGIDNRFALASARIAEALNELDYTDRAKNELLRIQSLDEQARLATPDRLYLEAITATVRRDFARAIATYRQLVSLEPNSPAVHFDLGRAYERADKLNESLASYIRATELDARYAAAFMRAGILYGRRQDLAAAANAFDSAESLYRDLGNAEGRAETIYQRGVFFSNLERVAEARAQFQSALELARANGNDYQQIRALFQLSYVLTTEGNPQQAEIHATEAINQARRLGMENLAASGLIHLGNVFFARESTPEAEEYFRQSLETARRIGARSIEARAQLSLGSLHIQRGNIDEGAREVEQALIYYQQGGYGAQTAQALFLLGRVHKNRGDYAEAFRLFTQQLQIAEQIGDKSKAAFAHGEMGSVHSLQENYPEALRRFEESSRLHAETGARLYLGYSLRERGDMLWRIGRYSEAHTAFGQASAIAENSDASRALLASIRLQKAYLAYSQNQFRQAIEFGGQAMTMVDERTDSLTARAKIVIGLAQAFSGDTFAGRETCAEAVAAASRSGNSYLLARTRLALAEVLLESDDARGARDLAAQAYESFASANQRDSEWQAHLVFARACQNMGDRGAAEVNLTRARTILVQLQQQWGAEVFNAYLARPDIQLRHRQLGGILPAVQ